MIRIAVAENSPSAMEQMKQFLERYREERGLSFQTSFFTDGMDLARQYAPNYDLIFLDVEMPGMDGMATARHIRSLDGDVILVFVTRMAQYALKGYEVRAMDFMVKPLSYPLFQVRMDLLLSRIPSRQERHILLSTREGTRKLPVNRIIYVEVIRHKLFFHTEDGVFEIGESMKWAEEQLEGCPFARCDNGVLVHLPFVTWVGQKELMAGNCLLKVSRPRRKVFLQALADYMGEHL